jgi:hypothetical protein
MDEKIVCRICKICSGNLVPYRKLYGEDYQFLKHENVDDCNRGKVRCSVALWCKEAYEDDLFTVQDAPYQRVA